MADNPERSKDEASSSGEKSLEMRVTELEDRLAQLHITEDEIKAYQKVSSLLGGGRGVAAGGGGVSAGCVDCVYQCINECLIRACTIVRNCTIVRQCTIIRQCAECFECGGGFSPGGGMAGGSGFGTLGG
jgi:hypothetical protein